MNLRLQKIVFLLLLLAGHVTNAQVKFSASLTPDQISKDEYTQLRLMVENARDVQDIVPPVLSNFIIISGPSRESGMTMINGDVKKYVALNFVLRAKGPGTFTIPSTIAKADDREYRSNPVTIKVSNMVSGNTSGSNAFSSPLIGMDPFEDVAPRRDYQDYILHEGESVADKIRKNMVLKLTTDKTTCFVGEPVIATYKLYTRLKSESNMAKNPSFNGFSVIDLQQPDNVNYKIEKLNGREYNVYTIRKAQLYPLQPGRLELETAEIENNVQFVKAAYMRQQADQLEGMFPDFGDMIIPPDGMENHKITLHSDPLSILVKPLPEAGRPAGFKGAVGNFAIEASLAKNNFSTDDAGQLTVIISGVGNLQLVTTPEIAWPPGIEGFEPKVTDDLFKTTVPVSGRKNFEFPFTVARPGNYSLPAFEFSFFDAKSASYKTVSTKALNFSVGPGTGKPKKIETDETIKGKTFYLAEFFSKRWRVVGLIAIIILSGLLFWLRRDHKKDKLVSAAALQETAITESQRSVLEMEMNRKNPLAQSEYLLQKNDGTAFYKGLNQELKKFLSDKLEIPLEDLNKKSIGEKMDARGIPNATCLQLNELIDEIEWQLYTPSSGIIQMEQLYEKANGIIGLLNAYKI